MIKNQNIILSEEPSIQLLNDLKSLIEQGKSQVTSTVNSVLNLTYWHIGKRINEETIQGERAEYGKRVIASLSKELVLNYGNSFEVKNLRRMMQFAELFPDIEIVVPLARQLSWSHFLAIIPLKTESAQIFYARAAAE